MIVKLQRPPASSDRGRAPALLYNEDRTFHIQTHLSPDILKIMGIRPKIYVEIIVDGDKITIVREVEAQPW
jgi:hypothetical protein